MNRSDGQDRRTRTDPPVGVRGTDTRNRILAAAAELIGELGWSAVTTRQIARRAGVPHGAVSYHFAGKAELLRQAAVAGTEAALAGPVEIARGAGGLVEVVEAMLVWFASGELDDPALALLLETARQAGRDPGLRELVAAIIAQYRAELAELIKRDQRSSTVRSDVDAEGLAAIVAALFDGLLMHVILDPGLDAGRAIVALRALVGAKR